MTKLRVAVSDTGSIARYRHLGEFNNHSESGKQFVTLSKKEHKRLHSDIEAKAYTSYEKLFEVEKPDAVGVCLPNSLHAIVFFDLLPLQAGCHVLCEKPMATSRAEAEENGSLAAKKNKKKLMIAHNQRFVASHAKAQNYH